MPQYKQEITIAVLPFQILNKEEDLSPVILGFSEDLIFNLSKFIGLSVVSQYSTRHIKEPSQLEEINQVSAKAHGQLLEVLGLDS